jgi:acyl-CoA synthetase (AMP-forming)/AMP-acid ligase II
VYSGTTGYPKAVMLTHDNINFEGTMIGQHQPLMGATYEQERILSYLPLSHAAGLLVDVAQPIVVTATQKGWMTTYFARPYDLKAGTLAVRLRCVRPTFFLGVVSVVVVVVGFVPLFSLESSERSESSIIVMQTGAHSWSPSCSSKQNMFVTFVSKSESEGVYSHPLNYHCFTQSPTSNALGVTYSHHIISHACWRR